MWWVLLACASPSFFDGRQAEAQSSEVEIAEFPACLGQLHPGYLRGYVDVEILLESAVVRLDGVGAFRNFGVNPKVKVKAYEHSSIPCHLRVLKPTRGGLREERWLIPPIGGAYPPYPATGDVMARFQQRGGLIEVYRMEPVEMVPLTVEWAASHVTSKSGAWYTVRTPDGPYQFAVPVGSIITFVELDGGRFTVEWGGAPN